MRSKEERQKTYAMLKERLLWNLDQKIDHCVATIENFKARTGHNCYVSFSGGKDSTVLLDIARRWVDKNMLAVFCNTGNEFPNIVAYVKTFPNVEIIHPAHNVKEVIENLGFPLISKDTSEKLRQLKHSRSQKLIDIRLHGYPDTNGGMAKCPAKWVYLKDAKFDISERCCDYLKKRRFKQFERETGLYPLIGTTTSESRLRTQQYLTRGGCSAFDGKRPRSYPISIFTNKDIHDYCQRFKINLCSLYDDGNVRQSGCMVCGFGADQDAHHFDYLFQHYPKVYKYFLNLKNNGVTYREALHTIGVRLPDDD